MKAPVAIHDWPEGRPFGYGESRTVSIPTNEALVVLAKGIAQASTKKMLSRALSIVDAFDRRGARIWSLKQLMNAAQWKRAVIGNSTFVTRPQPAAFIVSMQARIVYKLLQDGLWFYKPIRPTKGVTPS